jgi:hypothetical protein
MNRHRLQAELEAIRDDPTAFPASRKAAIRGLEELRARRRLALRHCAMCGQSAEEEELVIEFGRFVHRGECPEVAA